jgi:prepilin-type N-terminal cleavage/methylation domain-containing protein/prepilin-type processing-associated H-X9-DG protein
MKRTSGFTLIELLFVIAVIGVILSLLAPALVTVKRRAQALQCMSRLHQIGIAVQAYTTAHDETIPFIVFGPEARTHPEQWYEPTTGVPSLSHFLELEGAPPEPARCVADTGCPGQSLYATAPGLSCFEDWGQSMMYNNSCYREEGSPGFDTRLQGALYGSIPQRLSSVVRHDAYLQAADFWAHWHFGTTSSSSGPYYTNILFFDGHVVGKHYTSLDQAIAYLNWDGVRRWWIEDPVPLSRR